MKHPPGDFFALCRENLQLAEHEVAELGGVAHGADLAEEEQPQRRRVQRTVQQPAETRAAKSRSRPTGPRNRPAPNGCENIAPGNRTASPWGTRCPKPLPPSRSTSRRMMTSGKHGRSCIEKRTPDKAPERALFSYTPTH